MNPVEVLRGVTLYYVELGRAELLFGNLHCKVNNFDRNVLCRKGVSQ